MLNHFSKFSFIDKVFIDKLLLDELLEDELLLNEELDLIDSITALASPIRS
jgi:hypothetical protein